MSAQEKTFEKAPPEDTSGVFDSTRCVITYIYKLRFFRVIKGGIIYAYSYLLLYFLKNRNVITVASSSENTTEYQTP